MHSFYTIITSDIILNEKLTNTDKVVFSIISAFSNNKNGYSYLKYSDIAKYAGIKKRELYYILNKLIKLNILTKISINDKSYLMPTINYLAKKNKDKNKLDREEERFYYNWLEEEDTK